jgi:hypothetical protein
MQSPPQSPPPPPTASAPQQPTAGAPGRSSKISVAQAKRLVLKHFEQLSELHSRQETDRDKTLVLITGGALTVSFAFVSSLIEHTHFSGLRLLLGAWIAWAAALVVILIGYQVSLSAIKRRINRLAAEDYAGSRIVPWWAYSIEPLNVAGSVACILGFIFFTIFAYQTLKGLDHERVAQHTQTQNVTQEGTQEGVQESADQSAHHAGAPAGFPGRR